MARAAHRSLTPSSKFSNPAAAGVSGFSDSLNNALIRAQNFKQQQALAGNKQKSALELAMEKYYNLGGKPLNDARIHNLNAGTGEKKAKTVSTSTKNQPVNNLDDLFKNDQKTYQAKLQHAHQNWDSLKKDPMLWPNDVQVAPPEQRMQKLQDYFKQNNADDAAILSHAATHLVSGQQPAQQNSTSPINVSGGTQNTVDMSQFGNGANNGFK